MSEELKPCPFCGGKAITSTFFDWDDLDYMDFEVNDNESIDGEVTCENERCINGWYLSPKDWQTRPIEDALNKRIAELEAFIERLIEAGRMMKQPETIEEFHQGRRDYDALVAEWKESRK